MRLHGLVYYRSKSDDWTGKWRDGDYAAMNVVKAVKGLPFGGKSTINVGGQHLKIDNTLAGRANALNATASALAHKIQQAGYTEAHVVPIPSSSHIDPSQNFTGKALAAVIQAKVATFLASPVLYFDEVQKKAHEGGGRNEYVIQRHLRMTDFKPQAPVVLLDDVYTTGGHMKAAAKFFAAAGIEVNDAFVVGRTAWKQPGGMFQVETEEVQTKGLLD